MGSRSTEGTATVTVPVHVVPDRGRVGVVLGEVVHIPDQDASQEGGQCAEQEDRAEKEGEGHRGQNIRLEEQEGLKATEIHSSSGKASEVWRRSEEPKEGIRIGRGAKAKRGGEEIGGRKKESLQACRGAAGRARSGSQVGVLRLLQAGAVQEGRQVQVLARPGGRAEGGEAEPLRGRARQR